VNRCLWILLLVVAPVSTVVAQRKVAAGIGVASDVAIRVWAPSGVVRLIAWDRDSVAVSGTVDKRANFFGGGAGSHAKFGIEASNPKDPVLPGGELTFRVPRASRVWVKMISGQIDATGVTGEVELYLVGGSVNVRNAAGVISVESIDAPVILEGVVGAVRIRGGKGDVTLRDVSGTATVATVSGGVTIVGPRLPDARIETIGGAIIADARLTGSTVLDLQTHSGAITLSVNPAMMPALELLTRGGKVLNEFKPSKGTARVVARSFKGDISVRPTADIKGGKSNL